MTLRRVVSVGLVAFLVVATAVAFAVTERLKLVHTPITGPRVDKYFSPVCECPKRTARIRFRLRRADRLTLAVVDDDGEVVRTLFESQRRRPGLVVTPWDGRDETGAVVPEGTYRPRLRLLDDRKTIVLPTEIRVDVTRPQIRLLSVRPRVFSPNGDGRREWIRARYRASERARGLIFANGRLVNGPTLRYRPEWQLDWFGRRHRRGVPAGSYRITLRAEDRAGNVSAPTFPVRVRVRYVELGRTTIRVRAGSRFRVRVSTDSPSVRWRLAGRAGVAARNRLVLRAPARPGRYRLFVAVKGRADSAHVVVTRG